MIAPGTVAMEPQAPEPPLRSRSSAATPAAAASP